MVIPRSYGCITLFSVNGVDVGTFIEGDELVTGVGVLDCEHCAAKYYGVDAKCNTDTK